MMKIFFIILLCFVMLPSYVKGQIRDNALTQELYKKEFPVLRSFKNKRIAEIESLRDRMLLLPTNTDEGIAMWRDFLDFSRQSLISFPLDTYDKDDENYWSRIIATMTPLFYICCDHLDGREKEAYNNALTLKNFLYHGYKYEEIKQTTWEDVRDMLDDGEVAIELRVLPEEALILKKSMNCPVSVPIDSILVERMGMYKGADAVEISEMYSDGGTLAKFWNSISPSISGAKRIYLSASHFFCNFNFGAIPTGNSSTVDEDYDFHYLVSTEDILNVKNRKETTEYQTAAIFGDITYDMSEEKMLASTLKRADNQTPAWDLTRGMDDATRGKLLPLQHSKEELVAINDLLCSKGMEVKKYDATNASEETFKDIVGSKPEIIHLSTHGFMLAPMYNESDGTSIYPESIIASKYATDMLKSGLLLAGASRVWNGKAPIDGVEDGILTTKELLEMDFRGTKLAVLSACKTGLGNDTNLTGLSIGPQHALKTKGVEQIVMSLWMVDDAATTLLMKYFYESLLVGNGAKSALKYAQRKLIEEGYTDPYYWAAFVVLE
jgi:hypothetical protein